MKVSPAKDPHVMMMITLDKSQAGGLHEKKLLNSDVVKNARLNRSLRSVRLPKSW
jgi:hypothetical protein